MLGVEILERPIALLMEGNHNGHHLTESEGGLTVTSLETNTEQLLLLTGFKGLAKIIDVTDESSVIFTEIFYHAIGQAHVSRAQALRQAQQTLMTKPKFDHPRYWAPYILIGNWL